MKRLPITGTSLAIPKLGEEEFKRVLAGLGAAAVFDDAAVHDLYMKLAAIHGEWLSLSWLSASDLEKLDEIRAAMEEHRQGGLTERAAAPPPLSSPASGGRMKVGARTEGIRVCRRFASF